MPPVPLDNDNAFPRYPLAQMVVAPLIGQVIGLNASGFVIAEDRENDL